MRVVIAGGHGKIALILERLLADDGHDPVALIRNPAHAADVEAAGAAAVVLDLEAASVDEVAAVLAGADAVVFAAGAGPGSTAERKLTVDRDGAILLADAAKVAGVPRIVVISAMRADDFDAASDDVFQIYLRAKSEADAAVRASGLDFTIVRPGALTDTPATGFVVADTTLPRGSISRADVAATVAAVLTTGAASRRQFELTEGGLPIAGALAALPDPA
ncbi:NAD(P)H-binding [Agromyces sp. CF514]|uniref:NAD(P)H-binding protein n=1 Tax=Agromyces sp. CF514 TaxID=1881031 RepID=UPI0008ED0FDF|nr:NAD(P)H-binding protein [Agromyces sp. CF514]SFR83146.1 NAD(P)H-binding [Agromyces sp. CF514]